MQTLFICDFPLPGNPQTTWDEVHSEIEQWSRNRLGLQLTDDGAEHRNGEVGSSGRRLRFAGADGSQLELWQVRKVDPRTPLWAYDVTIWLMRDQTAPDPQTVVRVRLTAHALHGQVAELPAPPAAPGVVRTLLDNYSVTVDGQRLGKPLDVDEAGIPQLLDLLHDPDRRRPVLVLTTAPGRDEPGVDAERTALRLGGLAHVAVIRNRAATFALTDGLVRSDLSVFNGAARLYWPGLHPHSRRGDHPLWFADRLVSRGPTWFADRMFAHLGGVSALSLGPPPLERRLRRETDQALRAADAEQLATLRQQYNTALAEVERLRSEAQVAVPKEEIPEDEWFAEFDKVSDELEAVANERDDLQEQVEALERELTTAKENIQAMAAASGVLEERTSTAADESESASSDPVNVLAAVEWAASTSPHLDVLPEAFESARASEYQRPAQVLEDLAALEKVAAAWSRGELPTGGFEPALVAEGCSGYRTGISRTARRKFKKDYERTYHGQTIMLGPHIARGVGSPKSIMRIYWYADEANRVLVIGHVGQKLRDDSNP